MVDLMLISQILQLAQLSIIDVSQTETRVKRSTYTRKFKSSDVDTANTLNWMVINS